MISIVLDIQQNLNAPKNLYNNFGGYSYRSCESILVALKPLLLKHKAIIYFKEQIIEQNGWHYIEATACLRAEGKEEIFTTTGYAREDECRKGMDASQITGSASSYARKYALNAMFAIDDVKDSDATNKHGKDEPQPQELPTLEQFTQAVGKLNSYNELFKYWSKQPKEITENKDYKDVINKRREEVQQPKK